MTVPLPLLQVQSVLSVATSFSWLRWVGAAILLAAALLLLSRFFATVERDPPRFESNWGFGGSQGGWRMSASLAYLIGAVAFAVMFTIVAKPEPPPDSTKQTGADDKKTEGEKADAAKKDVAKKDAAKLDAGKDDARKPDAPQAKDAGADKPKAAGSESKR